MSPLVVAKVGGSLFDLPDLAERLSRWLAPLPSVLVVPGGGPMVDAIRRLDRLHQLGEEAAHWLALHALSVNAQFLARLLPGAEVTSALPETMRGCRILDPYAVMRTDDMNPDHLPHLWQVTSDSLAVRVAALAEAQELVLLKSVDWDVAQPWQAALDAKIVDAYFPIALSRLDRPLTVRVVNLRQG
jgi:5-(aminomethyl)-3-furanmethanol phosphate kinase